MGKRLSSLHCHIITLQNYLFRETRNNHWSHKWVRDANNFYQRLIRLVNMVDNGWCNIILQHLICIAYARYWHLTKSWRIQIIEDFVAFKIIINEWNQRRGRLLSDYMSLVIPLFLTKLWQILFLIGTTFPWHDPQKHMFNEKKISREFLRKNKFHSKLDPDQKWN